MRALLILLLSIALSGAATTANTILHPDAASRGLLNSVTLSNAALGTHGLVAYSGTNATGLFQRIYSDVNPDLTFAFRQPITVGGVSYSGSATNWIRMDSATNLSAEFIDYEFTGGSGGSISNALIAGPVRWCVTNNLGQQINLDTIILYGGGGSWAVCQADLDVNGNLIAASHGATNGVSQSGAGVTLTPCKTYFRVLYRNPTQGWVGVKFYDPLDWSLTGESVCAISGGTPGDNSWTAQFKVGYIGNPPLNMWLGDTFIIYDASNADYTNIVNAAPFPVIAGNATFGNVSFR